MKYLVLLLLLLPVITAHGQTTTTAAGDFMDITYVPNLNCSNSAYYYYYSVKGKYPKSSATLLKEVQAFLQQQATTYTGSGYITFHFIIDCEGTPHQQVRVTQTNQEYQPYAFDKQLVQELYLFYKTLDQWKVGMPRNDVPANYFAFITFKINNGKVVAVVP